MIKRSLFYRCKNLSNLEWQRIDSSSNEANLFVEATPFAAYTLRVAGNTPSSQQQANTDKMANDLYTAIKNNCKKPVKIVGRKQESANQPTMASNNSYQQLNYRLSPAQQKQGILAVADNISKAFFSFGGDPKFKELIQQNLQGRLTNGIAPEAFLAKQGQFQGFKYLANLKQYELKTTRGERITFEEQGKIQIKDDAGMPYEVPVWIPLQHTHK